MLRLRKSVRPLGIATWFVCFATVAAGAKSPWEAKTPEAWNSADAERILSDSPWAQAAEATFPDPRDREALPPEALPGPAQAGMAGSRGVSDGKWDGGVARNNGGALPTLQVIVRWESALVVRQARERLKALGAAGPGPELAGMNTTLADANPSNYVLSVVGLVPARQYKTAEGTIEPRSSSNEANAAAEADTERLLESFMTNSALAVRGAAPIRPDNVQVEPATGTVRLYFQRTGNIQAKDKEVYFSTRYGSLTVRKKFRLSDMFYHGKLEL